MGGVPISRILGFPTWESKEKWYLSAAFMLSHRKYYNMEDGGFTQVWAVMNFVSLCMLVHQKIFNYALTTCCLVCVGPYE